MQLASLEQGYERRHPHKYCPIASPKNAPSDRFPIRGNRIRGSKKMSDFINCFLKCKYLCLISISNLACFRNYCDHIGLQHDTTSSHVLLIKECMGSLNNCHAELNFKKLPQIFIVHVPSLILHFPNSSFKVIIFSALSESTLKISKSSIDSVFPRFPKENASRHHIPMSCWRASSRDKDGSTLVCFLSIWHLQEE